MEDQNEKTIYELFRFSLWLKAIGSVGEMLIGFVIAFIPSTFILHASFILAKGDTGGDADDVIARWFHHEAQAFAVNNNLLLGVYIFFRGLIQFLIVLALFQNKRWAYPALLIVLFAIVLLQSYAIYFSHSLATGVITLVDIATIFLVAHEYIVVRRLQKK